MRPEHRLADDEPFGERDAGERAELRVAALDQLQKRGDVRRVGTAPAAGGVNCSRGTPARAAWSRSVR